VEWHYVLAQGKWDADKNAVGKERTSPVHVWKTQEMPAGVYGLIGNVQEWVGDDNDEDSPCLDWAARKSTRDTIKGIVCGVHWATQADPDVLKKRPWSKHSRNTEDRYTGFRIVIAPK